MQCRTGIDRGREREHTMIQSRPAPSKKKKEEKMQLGQGRSFLDHVTSDKLGVEGLAKCSGRALDNDTCGLEGRDLGVCATLAAGDDST